jgi:hypothetical protein
LRRLLAASVAVLLAGCGGDPRGQNAYGLSVPAGWQPWRRAAPPVVPGDVLEAHEAPPGGPRGSLVVFRSGYVPETTAAQILVATRFLLLNLPSLEIKAAREIAVAGKPAVLVEAVADGTGDALAPTGLGKPVAPAGESLVRTRRAWVRIPRGPEDGTLEVFFHAPEAEYEKLAPVWAAVLASLRA